MTPQNHLAHYGLHCGVCGHVRLIGSGMYTYLHMLTDKYYVTGRVESVSPSVGIQRSYSDTIPVTKMAAWHGGSTADLFNPPLTFGSDAMQFTQSLSSIQRNGHGGQKTRSASAIEGVGSQGVVRRLDFSLNDKIVADKSSVGELIHIILYHVCDYF